MLRSSKEISRPRKRFLGGEEKFSEKYGIPRSADICATMSESGTLEQQRVADTLLNALGMREKARGEQEVKAAEEALQKLIDGDGDLKLIQFETVKSANMMQELVDKGVVWINEGAGETAQSYARNVKENYNYILKQTAATKNVTGNDNASAEQDTGNDGKFLVDFWGYKDARTAKLELAEVAGLRIYIPRFGSLMARCARRSWHNTTSSTVLLISRALRKLRAVRMGIPARVEPACNLLAPSAQPADRR